MADWNTFITRYPEFAGTDPAIGTPKLLEATRQINVPQWADLAEDGIYLLTAQKLARTPMGNAEYCKAAGKPRDGVTGARW